MLVLATIRYVYFYFISIQASIRNAVYWSATEMAKCSKTISLLIQILLAKRCVPHHWKVIYNISCKWIVEQKTVSIFWIGIHKRYSILYSTTITILSIFVFPLLEHYWHYDLFYGYNGFVYLITEICMRIFKAS